MKQIVIISGKGGTGKTVITASFAALAENFSENNSGCSGKVMVDCDVDAADLHLLLTPQINEKHEFRSGVTAFIDKNKCNQCGLCNKLCRFSAIDVSFSEEGSISTCYRVDPVACEGCAFCSFACPQKAIEMKENLAGEWYISDTRFGPMVHAKLGIAEENSGKLVSLVREKAKQIAKKNNAAYIIIDGSPGIGCPVIASLSGVDCALVVTEPTISGLHDADRVIQVAKHFNVPVKLMINKYDLNIQMSEEIENYCRRENIPFVGKLKFDKEIVQAMVNNKTIVEYSQQETTNNIKAVWEKIKNCA